MSGCSSWEASWKAPCEEVNFGLRGLADQDCNCISYIIDGLTMEVLHLQRIRKHAWILGLGYLHLLAYSHGA